MTTAKRYTIVECHNDDEVWFKMKEVAHGEYVLYSDYKELEQELTKLKESQTQLCNRVDKAEADKAELEVIFQELISECILMPYEHLYYINRIKDIISNKNMAVLDAL